MMSLAAAVALVLLPGLLILRGPVWLALPASSAFWLASWSLCALGMERSPLLNGGLAVALGLTLVGLPRLSVARVGLSAAVAGTVTVAAGAAPWLGLPWSHGVAEEAAAARLLAWGDGLPLTHVPLADARFAWPGGVAPLVADLLLLGDLPVPEILWVVATTCLLAFVVVVAAPREGRKLRGTRVGAATAAGVGLAALDPGWLLASTLAVAAARLLRERRGAPASFGAAVLLGGAAIVQPLIALVAAAVMAWRRRSRATAAVVGAVLLVAPLGVPRVPRWPRGHLQGPTAAQARALDTAVRDAPQLASVCAPHGLAPWMPALAGRRAAGPCPEGLTSFHTVPPNPVRANP